MVFNGKTPYIELVTEFPSSNIDSLELLKKKYFELEESYYYYCYYFEFD